MPRKSFDWTNVKKNKLTGVRKVQSGPAKWIFLCDCGKETVAFAANVKKGHTKSCGCLRDDFIEKKKQQDSRIKTICKECQIEFKHYIKKRKGEGVFCSNKCKYAYGRSTVQCTNCGISVERLKSKLGRFKNNFCGSGCCKKYYSGERHPMHKGGNINPDGYMRISVAGVSMLEHRYVVEQHIGRKLTSEEHVHHLDENKLNNDISNLKIVTNSEHQKVYHPRNLTKLRFIKQGRI